MREKIEEESSSLHFKSLIVGVGDTGYQNHHYKQDTIEKILSDIILLFIKTA